MPARSLWTAVALTLLCCSSLAASASLPAALLHQLPRDYEVIASARSNPNPRHVFYFVALASPAENKRVGLQRAPPRPFLVFESREPSRFSLTARNDNLIFRADDGGISGCDPFEQRRISVRGFYVTIEQGLACGAHWTDYVTFRFDPKSAGYVFDNWRTQSWSLNASNDPNAEALVSDGQNIVRATGRKVPLAKWRRPTR